MAAAAVSSLACPLRRSTRLTSRRTHDDDENELTPRALRALKRQRLALDLPRPKRRRKEHLPVRKHDPPPPSPEPLSPLTPLTPSPESSPSLPGHDRPSLPPSPPPDLPPPPEPAQPPSDHLLDASLDTLIPFHPHFHPDLAVQIPPPCPPQPLELQDQFHSFPQPQLYVPPPVFVRDREINIWKLACQERVDCLLRRYGIDYIKALVQSEARSQDARSTSSQTKFRLYTPASYTYSSTSWGSTSGPRKPFPFDDDDPDASWPIDDADWVEGDVDMEDDDEDDDEDDEDTEGDSAIDAVQDLVISDSPAPQPALSKPDLMHTDPPTKSAPTDTPSPPRPTDTAPRPLTPTPHVYLPPPSLAPPTLPPLSSLHVPLLSEPPRAFMGRGTPPDRQRLIEWSSGRFTTHGMGPPLYLSPVPQRHPSPDVGIVPMSVDQPMHPPPQHPHANGEWTSFLFSVLEGDGVVGVGNNVAPPHPTGPTWYELGLGSVPQPNGLDLSLPQTTRAGDPPIEDASSSTLRFALG